MIIANEIFCLFSLYILDLIVIPLRLGFYESILDFLNVIEVL